METLYPPRPKSKILPTQLPQYDNGNWVAQRKFNGTRILLRVENGNVEIMTREQILPRQFVLTSAHKKEILSLNLDPDKKYWLDGELLDAKTTTEVYKGRIVLYDVLQAGKYLFGMNLLSRLSLLNELCGKPQNREPNLGIALQATKNIWMAETFENDFVARYNDFIQYPEIEGVVLKQRKSSLDNLGKSYYEVGWLLRCRKPTKNYLF